MKKDKDRKFTQLGSDILNVNPTNSVINTSIGGNQSPYDTNNRMAYAPSSITQTGSGRMNIPLSRIDNGRNENTGNS